MYLINGKEVKKEDFNIPVENLAIWRGDGIFEAIAIHNGYLFAIDKHMERFAKSAEKMFFDDIDFTKIKEDLISIASKFDNGYMRVIIGRGTDKDKSDVYIFYQDLINFPESFSLQSQKAHWQSGGDFSLDEVENIGSKTISYAMNINQTRLAQKSGYTDSLLLNKDGIVLEGPTFCVSWIIDNKIYVPSLDLGILDSITRRTLIDIAKEAGLDLKIENIHINDIYNVDTVFALSTAKHGIFVSQIDDQTYTEDPLLEIIRQSFTDFIEKERQLNK
ncbi:MAG: aminotransferase class IV [Candidatus Actinomarina sp.]|jgi:branched-subunit amino acid aminotransferase/4-amino-4-deoxychorismate lyase|nr:aminotransferase class IV [Acidimicrobiaceae bacterium]|tara:strand:+ start:1993 stop:2820 length:828 start_codon:yes stop_codon:yes gene_type:complete